MKKAKSKAVELGGPQEIFLNGGSGLDYGLGVKDSTRLKQGVDNHKIRRLYFE